MKSWVIQLSVCWRERTKIVRIWESLTNYEIIASNCSILNLKYMQKIGSQTCKIFFILFLGVIGNIILINVIQKYFATFGN